MKCEHCDLPGTSHVTERVNGDYISRHLCEKHAGISPPPSSPAVHASHEGVPTDAIRTIFRDPELRAAAADEAANEKLASYLLPPLYLALQDERAEVRVTAALWIAELAKQAASATGAVHGCLRDPDERVRRAASVVLEWISFAEHAAPAALQNAKIEIHLAKLMAGV
jgi:hypothetical protein